MRRTFPARASALALLGILAMVGLTTLAVPGDADAHVDRLWSRARLGTGDGRPLYILELWTDLPGDRIRDDEAPEFRFDILWRANGSRVAPGPDLQVFAYRCSVAAEGSSGGACDEEAAAATETGYILRDADDGIADGRYPWEPQADRVFDAQGPWQVEVFLAGGNESAIFVFPTAQLGDAPIVLVRLLELLFGTERSVLASVLVTLFWIVVFLLVWRGLVGVARRSVFAPSRMDPTVSRLAVRLLSAIWIIIMVAWTLWVVWRIDFWAGLTALGLLSVALGFGMQTTVANLMGGINLASDKPFVIGDRIEVGESWGDVQEIGLRSTKIMTPRKEIVIIPNKLLDEREIWNYTRDHQELRLDIDAGISYGSDWRLAEAVMIHVACKHPEILAYPRPRVLMMGFGESSIDLQLRCWLATAKDARIVASDLRKGIKDGFDEHGVEIPFPYRTLVYKNELEPPRKATPDEIADLRPSDVRLPRMLYATAGPPNVQPIADFVARIASELDVQLTVLYVTAHRLRHNRAEKYRVFSAFQDAAARNGVPIRTLHEVGDVVPTIKRVIENENIDLVTIGSHRHAILPLRNVADFTKEIRESVQLPVLIVPRSLRISEKSLTHYRKIVEERQMMKERKRAGIVQEGEDEREVDLGEDLYDENGSEEADDEPDDDPEKKDGR